MTRVHRYDLTPRWPESKTPTEEEVVIARYELAKIRKFLTDNTDLEEYEEEHQIEIIHFMHKHGKYTWKDGSIRLAVPGEGEASSYSPTSHRHKGA